MSGAVQDRFVFLDDAGRPYRVQLWGGTPWMFYWNEESRGWVSLRKIKDEQELRDLKSRALSEEMARCYDPMWERRHPLDDEGLP